MPTVLRFHCIVKLKGCCLIFSLKYCSMLQKGNPFSYTDVRIYKGVRVMDRKKKSSKWLEDGCKCWLSFESVQTRQRRADWETRPCFCPWQMTVMKSSNCREGGQESRNNSRRWKEPSWCIALQASLCWCLLPLCWEWLCVILALLCESLRWAGWTCWTKGEVCPTVANERRIMGRAKCAFGDLLG